MQQDKCDWNIDEPTHCWCCFCLVSWPSAIYKYEPYMPAQPAVVPQQQQQHDLLLTQTSAPPASGSGVLAGTSIPSLLSELEDLMFESSAHAAAKATAEPFKSAMRALRLGHADAFGRQFPLQVRTLAGDLYSVASWGAADDLHAAIVSEHPELASSSGRNGDHDPLACFELQSTDKRHAVLERGYRSSTRDEMLRVRKSPEVYLLYTNNNDHARSYVGVNAAAAKAGAGVDGARVGATSLFI